MLIGIVGIALTARTVSTPAPASMTATLALARSGLIANAFANAFGLLDQIIEEIADVVRHTVDHGKDLFENISNEVRSWDPEILGEISNVLGKLFGDAGMEDALLARTMTVATASGGMTGVRCLCLHESHCDSL